MRRALTIVLSVTCTVILQTLTINVVAAQSLTYQEGGAPGDARDPALDVSPSSRRYVCSNGGSDSNNGLTQATAWATISKINSSWNSIPSNAIIVLCRGGSWSSSSITNKAGTEDAPTAIGAYGSCTASSHFDNMCDNAPRVDGNFITDGSSWITLRDLESRRFGSSFGSHDMLYYRNQARGPTGGSASNIYKAFAESYHMVYVENIATDANTNDYFSAHVASGGIANHDGWWYIDNICIGSGGEDCIDVMQSESDQGSTHLTLDTKIIANRMVGQPLSGYSTLSGTANNCVNSGHEGRFYWWVGNICLGWEGDWIWSFARQSNQEKNDAHISGNVVLGDASSGNMMRNNARRQNHFHNIFANGSTGVAVQFSGEDQHFNYNVVIATGSTSGALISTTTQGGLHSNNILTWDNNWYGLSTGKTIYNGENLNQRQSNTSFDQNSNEGSINGFTMPTVSTYPNPNDWRGASFLNDITPSGAWPGCDGADTPGARDCNGNWLGWELNAISGAPNGGCGWAGLPIVGVKMTELGITGQCAPQSNGTAPPRPQPPVLISAQ